MTPSRLRRRISIAALVVALASTPGCTADAGGTAPTPDGGDSGEQVAGGTLSLLSSREGLDSLDPQQVVSADDTALLGSFIHRTLTSYARHPDPERQAVVTGDLATDAGTPSADLTEWSFTLRDDVTWPDGAPITCEDVKYGVSRTFAEDIAGRGPRVAVDLLDIPLRDDGITSAFAGPYDGVGQELFDEAVTCTENTITFRLRGPTPDFADTATRLTFSPVRAETDTGAEYGQAPQSSGPYAVVEYTEGERLVLRRNTAWNPTSDPHRPAHPDEVIVYFAVDEQQSDRRLIADLGDDRFALATGVDPADYSLVFGDDTLQRRRWSEPGLLVTYVALDTRRVPVLAHRQAILAALDRDGLQQARGGKVAVAQADGVLTPALALDYEPTGLWEGLLGQVVPANGDAVYARELIEQSGQPLPDLVFDYPEAPTAAVEADVVIASLAAAGITVERNPVAESEYFSVVLDPERSGHLSWVAWRPEVANASSVLPPLYDGDAEFNLSRVNQPDGVADPELQSLIDEGLVEPDRQAQAALWRQINTRATKLALVLPLTVDREQRLWGSGLDGVYYHAPYATYSYADVQVAQR